MGTPTINENVQRLLPYMTVTRMVRNLATPFLVGLAMGKGKEFITKVTETFSPPFTHIGRGWSLRFLDNGLACMPLAFSHILAKEKAFITESSILPLVPCKLLHIFQSRFVYRHSKTHIFHICTESLESFSFKMDYNQSNLVFLRGLGENPNEQVGCYKNKGEKRNQNPRKKNFAKKGLIAGIVSHRGIVWKERERVLEEQPKEVRIQQLNGYRTGTLLTENGTMFKIEKTNETYCSYSSDVATGYGVGESLLMGVTKCMCFGRPLTPGGNRAITFLVAEACLIAGATKNAYHTKYRGMIYAQNFSCEALRKGVFVAGAVFIVATMILNVYYYMYFTKATTTPVSHKANRVSSTVGMAGYA
ncbi:hypothetical protein V8G54_016269 [Vigna mungo]|uniref:Uncharacterized protein n=1 Tax=Vigna mungo TaxID=3915 RepID=A0AAQ3RXP4_VIGMU